MKILITSDWYSPAVNGVVTSVKNLRRELEAMGHEVRILTLSQNRHSWEKDGVVYLGSVAAGLVYPGARLRTALAGKQVRELVAWGPDVIHSQCEFSTFFLARRIAGELGVPLVHTYHTVYEDYTHYFSPSVHFGKKAAAVFTRWAASHTDCLIAPTGKVRMLLQNYGVAKPVFVAPSGIDLRRFQHEADPLRAAVLKASLHIPADRFVLACVGRLAGDGPDRKRLEGVAAGLGLEAPDVVFTGMIPAEQIADWYQLGDLFVSASTSETQGLTYAEALAAGVPVLCRADPCLSGVVQEGVNGWQYQDEGEFRKKLAIFQTQPHHWESFQKNARASAEEFSSVRFAERVEAIYLEQIQRNALRRSRG